MRVDFYVLKSGSLSTFLASQSAAILLPCFSSCPWQDHHYLDPLVPLSMFVLVVVMVHGLYLPPIVCLACLSLAPIPCATIMSAGLG